MNVRSVLYSTLFLVLGDKTRLIHGQNSALFTCVPPAFCPGGTINNPTIDPRIVTPGGTGGGGGGDAAGAAAQCPVGQAACFGQGSLSQCGRQLVSPVSTANGPAQAGGHPWQAFLTVNGAYIGSGVLLNNFHVLTAAHKVANYVASPGSVRVYMGVFNPADLTGTENSVVQKIILASDYNATTLRNDIAIMKLTNPIGIGVQNNINTACLSAAGTSFVGQSCMVAGWGQTSFSVNDAPTRPMKQVTVPIVDWNTCRTSFANNNLLGSNVDIYLDQNEICAGGQPMQDACTQDGGAPLVCNVNQRYYIAGLVIWGKNCGQTGVYGVYVSIPAYKDRIDNALRMLNTNINGINNF